MAGISFQDTTLMPEHMDVNLIVLYHASLLNYLALTPAVPSITLARPAAYLGFPFSSQGHFCP